MLTLTARDKQVLEWLDQGAEIRLPFVKGAYRTYICKLVHSDFTENISYATFRRLRDAGYVRKREQVKSLYTVYELV